MIRNNKQIYYLKNREKILQRAKNYQKKNFKKISLYRKGRRLQIVKYQTERLRTNPNARVAHNLRCRINTVLKRGSDFIKGGSLETLLGCSASEARSHLENKFKVGMSWLNYGEWEIDHIQPCASFDLSKEEEQKICFHFSNLQPLWELENMQKGAKVDKITSR